MGDTTSVWEVWLIGQTPKELEMLEGRLVTHGPDDASRVLAQEGWGTWEVTGALKSTYNRSNGEARISATWAFQEATYNQGECLQSHSRWGCK